MLRTVDSADDPLTVEVLELKMREQSISDYVVMLLRLLVSCEIQSEQEFFAPFVMVRRADAPPPAPLAPHSPLLTRRQPTPAHGRRCGAVTGDERRVPLRGDVLREDGGADGGGERPHPHRRAAARSAGAAAPTTPPTHTHTFLPCIAVNCV